MKLDAENPINPYSAGCSSAKFSKNEIKTKKLTEDPLNWLYDRALATIRGKIDMAAREALLPSPASCTSVGFDEALNMRCNRLCFCACGKQCWFAHGRVLR